MTGKSLHPATLRCRRDPAISIGAAGATAAPDLQRLSVGIEDPGDLLADRDAALSTGD